jgi:uncharacterized RDD family membrane protein YckC
MSTLFAPAPPAISGAGFLIRALARIIDAIVGTLLGFVGGIIGSILVLGIFGAYYGYVPEVIPDNQSTCLSMLLSIVGSILYHSITESISGYSIGKYVCRLRVVSTGLRPIGFESALIRNFYFLADAFFFGMVAYSSMSDSSLKQRIGDKRAKTIVISAADLPESIVKPRNVQVLGIIVGSYCYFLFLIVPWIATMLKQIFSD